ncbi:PilN domain-containing protein [Paenibacillaceae bacterium WGS1546]|uniref:PilN domain-containing protein n=1 Tax=Cohnella sp. WGS1546 TaxID=3366810 RepID=UPI00372D2330
MSDLQPNHHPLEINLLQLEEKVQARGTFLKPFILLSLLLAGSGVLGWLWYDASTAKERTEIELASVNASIAKLEEARTNATAAAEGAPIALLQKLPEAVANARPEMSRLLDKLGRMLPRDANLTSVEYSDGGKTIVSGRFASWEDIITFIREAKTSGEFGNVRLTQNKGTTDGAASGSSSEEEMPREVRTPEPFGPVSDKLQPYWIVSVEMDYVPAASAEQGGGA